MSNVNHIHVNAALAEGLNDAQRTHLESCAECRAHWESAQAEMAVLRGIDAPLAGVPESFWEAQRRSIRLRAAEARPRRHFAGSWTWVAAAAAVIVVSVSMMLPRESRTVTVPLATDEISDAALIQSVQDDLEGYPEALHPAQVMYVEMSSARTPAARRK
jgi:predicted anti-sigma-YlaC factor YlaD